MGSRVDNSEIIKEVGKYSDAALAYVKELPVHLLGSLASWEHLVISVETLAAQYLEPEIYAKKNSRYSAATRQSLVAAEIAQWVKGTRTLEAESVPTTINSEAGRLMYRRAWGEVVMWRGFDGKNEFLQWASPFSIAEWDEVRDWAELLTEVIQNPEFLPYAERGISDITVLKHCISEGIDIELAVSVYADDRTGENV